MKNYNNIEIIRKYRGLSRQKLGDKLNTSREHIFNIEKGHCGITQKNIKPICEALNCSIQDLFNENFDISLLEKNVKENKIIRLKYFSNLSLSVLNGSFIDYDDDINYVEFGEDFLIQNGIRNYKEIYIMNYAQDNMKPKINNKDFLFIDTGNKVINHGSIYILNENNIVKAKRLLKANPNKEIISIISENEDKILYPSYEVDFSKGESLEILGRVVMCCSIFG
ncbi:MAG: helix-turn-helix domain-containing protein [Rickettsiales bacterium]|jgi:phage repressor protein C with HTH and peptisase S24 domain|nr:helix-turn-helix domain-containing protein [Rickettsiales bacterium]